MKKQNVRTLSLIVCTFTYLLIGAAIFDALESNNETKNKEVLDEMERMFIEKYRFTREDYTILETVVLKGVPHKAGQQWKFAGAFYYATTVLTTIGYGHSTPHTIGGKLFTMAYALVGIPLGLVMFQSIGERLNNFSSFVIRNVKRVLKCGNVEASEINLIFVVFTLSSITIAGGAAAFSKYEGWTYFDSVYYCFVTLTTIGFGDMVALQQDNALDAKPEYVAFALIFILFGLAIVAASLNLLVLRLVTLNTEDERRDEAEALQAAQGAVRLEGDVITANGSIISGHLPKEFSGSLLDLNSVCSCSCQCPSCFPTRSSVKHRSSAHRHSYASYYTPGAGKATGEYGTLVGGSSASFSHLGSTALTVDSPQRRLSQIQPEWQVTSPLSSSAPTEYPSGGGVIYGVGSPTQIIREPDSASVTIARRSRVSLRGLVRRIRSLKRRIVQGNRPRYNVNVRRASNKSSIAVSHMNVRNTPPEKRTRRVSRIPPPVEVFTDPPLEDTGMFWGTIELTEKRASV